MTDEITPFSLKNAPALIERLLPVQKLSAESYKEQMAGSGKTLTALGSYWKGRKPLILNKACILGCLLPATDDPARDLAIFEKLMAMDDESFVVRWKRRPKPKEVIGSLSIGNISDYFLLEPEGILPVSGPVDWSNPEYKGVKVKWREDINELERRRIETQILPKMSYRERVTASKRAEEVMESVHEHIWDTVNGHLGTSASSFPELVEQLGIMRYGHRPRVADTFCGSGQIPFEAARLGCDVHASDLNPVACMLTWGAFNVIGGSPEYRHKLAERQQGLIKTVQTAVDEIGIEIDNKGWRGKVYLYCTEARCPQTGWLVPLLPTLIISSGRNVIARLLPDFTKRRYDIEIVSGASRAEMEYAKTGTISREGKYGEAYLTHSINGKTYKTKISTLRGDYQKSDGTILNNLRLWEKKDFKPNPEDIFQERLYCIQWLRRIKNKKTYQYEFRGITDLDLVRENIVEHFISENINSWQRQGFIPNMQIEVGGPPRYQGLDLIRARGWTHWHHVFNPRQLLLGGLVRSKAKAEDYLNLAYSLNYLSKLCVWDKSRDNAQNTFYNQALNTIFNYACRGTAALMSFLKPDVPIYPNKTLARVANRTAVEISEPIDIFITDPPYGDAIKYEEILDFFIAWLRKNPPSEFADWVWDSRRTLAIKGEDENFRRGMVESYKRMTECMLDNGIQVIMFTHQNGAIWADMANIVWASGLQVTAAWYVVTETDSALRDGSNVKGTVLLVCRKRLGTLKTTRDDLAWEIQEEVEEQVQSLTGLNQKAKGLYRDENVFEDADIQMAGYAAALRVLTRFAIIDGRDMTAEAIRPRVKGGNYFCG